MDSKSKKKSPQNLCGLFFENKGVEFINIACILHDPDIIKSLLSSSVKFPMPMVTCKLTPPISTKNLNLNKFVNNLDLDLYLTNLDSLLFKFNNFLFADRHSKHRVTGNLQIIRNNVLKNYLLKDLNIERLGL